MKYVFVALIVTAVAATLQCPAYLCQDKTWRNCYLKQIGEKGLEILVGECKEKEICESNKPIDEIGNCVNLMSLNNTFLPGEYCETNENCISKSCEKNKCMGEKLNAACTHTAFCDAGLYCDPEKKLCMPLLKINDACTGEGQCAINAVCHNGNCTQIGALDKGKAAMFPAQCKSYYMEKGECATPPALDTKGSNCSNSDVQCLYMDKTKKPCVCGMTNNTLPVCPLSLADAKMEGVSSIRSSD